MFFYCEKCNQSYPKTSKKYHDSFCNSNTKFCPYCNSEIDLKEYDEHIFCHKLDNELNGNNSNLNNNNINNNCNNYPILNNNKEIEVKRINSKIVKIGNTEFYDCEDEVKEIKKIEEEKKLYNEKILGLKKKKLSVSGKIKNFFSENGEDIIEVTFGLIGCVFLIPRCYVFVAAKMFEIFSRDKDNKEEGNEEKMDAKDIINYLPITKLGKKFDNKYNIEFKCIICYEDFKENDNITTLPCAHVFHIDCIKNWILAHVNCPICKFKITKKALLGEL